MKQTDDKLNSLLDRHDELSERPSLFGFASKELSYESLLQFALDLYKRPIKGRAPERFTAELGQELQRLRSMSWFELGLIGVMMLFMMRWLQWKVELFVSNGIYWAM